jgi:hypothetical protein
MLPEMDKTCASSGGSADWGDTALRQSIPPLFHARGRAAGDSQVKKKLRRTMTPMQRLLAGLAHVASAKETSST